MLKNFDTKSLKTIDDAEKDIVEQYKKDLVSYQKHVISQQSYSILRMHKTRQAVLMLHASNLEFEVTWFNERSVDIDLGFFKRNKAETARLGQLLKGIREAIGVKFDPNSLSNSIDDEEKKIISTTIKPDGFNGVSIRYRKKLQKTAKCKIVRRVVRSLECSI